MTNMENGHIWPGWETVRLIGRGSFGVVYEIQRDVFGHKEKAALKVISIPQSDGEIDDLMNEGYDSESITSRFEGYLHDIVREYSMMADMKGCANIVYCDDVRYIQHDDSMGWDIYIKMELLTPLPKALTQNPSEEQVIRIGEDICGALAFCEKRNLLHRDIKPQNIFVAQDGTSKLGDFGIAKTVERTTSGTKVGTYKYMAPEVYNNQPYSGKADIYSLGLVLYWLLNERRTPFLSLPPAKPGATEEDNARSRRFRGDPLPAPAHGSEELKNIVLKACAYDPKDRFQNAEEMLKALQAIEPREWTSAPVLSASASGAAALQDSGRFEATVSARTSGNNSDPDATVGVVAKVNNAPEEEAAPKRFEKGAPSPGQDKIVTSTEITSSEKKKKKLWPLIAAVLLLLVGTGVFLKLRQPAEKIDKPEPEPDEVVLAQSEWSDWTDELPASVNAENYEIETRTLYSSSQLETCSSTTESSIDGWELYDTVEGNGDFGPWSGWSGTPAYASETREVVTLQQYRYCDRETTTSSSSSLSGWELYDTTYAPGDYGAWSSWGTTAVSSSDTREVQSKTQYRYRSISYTTQYTDWGNWSYWSTSAVSSSDTVDVQTRTTYGYYYYLCPRCGAHMHGWGFTCPTWAGGCGQVELGYGDYCQYWSTTSPSNASFGDWHGTGRQYAYVDGVLVFRDDSLGSRTEYRYRTRSAQQVPQYGSWSSWGDTAVSSSPSRDVQTRKVYRYRDRTQVATYHFYRWGAWSAWQSEAVTQSNTRMVETTLFYSYRDRVTEKTYYFRRWTDWSEFSLDKVNESDTVKVQTQEQYRYRMKQ